MLSLTETLYACYLFRCRPITRAPTQGLSGGAWTQRRCALDNHRAYEFSFSVFKIILKPDWMTRPALADILVYFYSYKHFLCVCVDVDDTADVGGAARRRRQVPGATLRAARASSRRGAFAHVEDWRTARGVHVSGLTDSARVNVSCWW